jgi:glycosyltransferase involved in cell wall biosynthesis
MNILVISSYPPTPPLAGGRRRIFEQLSALRPTNEVDLVCQTYAASDDRQLAGIAKETGARVFSVRREENQRLRSRPFLVEKFWNEGIVERVRSLVGHTQYDWAVAEHCYCAEYLHGISAKKMLTEHNIEYRLLEQIAVHDGDLSRAFFLTGSPGDIFRNALKELPFLREYERQVWREMDLCVAMSEPESKIIAEETEEHRIQVIPNCPGKADFAEPLRPGPPRILFIGALNYFPNVDAALFLLESIVPRVWRVRPEVEIVVAGRDPQPQFIEFCRRSGVRIESNPSNINDFMTSGAVLACPLRFGSGTRIKILDAMAAGVPVVATHLAAEGLEVTEDLDILLADTQEEFSDHLLDLLGSCTLRKTLAEAGRHFLEVRNLRWPDVFAQLERRLQLVTIVNEPSECNWNKRRTRSQQ